MLLRKLKNIKQADNSYLKVTKLLDSKCTEIPRLKTKIS